MNGASSCPMDSRLPYAAAVGILLYAIDIFLRQISAGPALVLFFIAGLIVGIAATSVKWGFALTFVLTFVFQIIVVAGTVNLLDPNIFGALLALAALNSFIVSVLGGIGGLIGGMLFRKKVAPPPPAAGAASG